MTTTACGPRRCRVRARSSGSACGVAAGEHARLGQVGGDDGREREQLLDERRAGRVVEQHGAGLGDHHRVDHDGRAGLQQAERLPDGADGLRGAEHPDLDRVDADVLRRPAGPARRSSPAASVCTALTPVVFCAVSAVIAVIPWTPQRANAFRSAWMPAPPPESEPAIERTAGIGPRMPCRVGGVRVTSTARTARRTRAAQPEQLQLRQRPRGGLGLVHRPRQLGQRPLPALDGVEHPPLARVERHQRGRLRQRRGVGAEDEVEHIARAADDRGARVQQLVGPGREARGDRAGHRRDHATEVGGEVGGDQRPGPRRRLDHDRDRRRARR